MRLAGPSQGYASVTTQRPPMKGIHTELRTHDKVGGLAIDSPRTATADAWDNSRYTHLS